MFTPSATYRLQFHKEFTLEHLEEIIPYLHELGISTIYASPITTAVPGSTHGYDVTDPHTINPEIGTREKLASITTRLQQKNMTWLQDIVPNHMAFHQANQRLMDVLERGAASDYYRYFDILWNHPDYPGTIMVPFLGDEPDACLQKGEIQLSATANGFFINYYDNAYPLSVPAQEYLLSVISGNTGFQWLTDALATLSANTTFHDWQEQKQAAFSTLINHHQVELNSWLATCNADKSLLQQLLDRQYYQFCFWKLSNTCINYRRFFTINALICLRMEDESVFEEYHRFLHELYQQGLLQGLRIDHIDGLYDPAVYLDRLRALFGEDCYVVAEKILGGEEWLPADWHLQGTSGYDFLAYVNQLLTNRTGKAALTSFYRTLVPDTPPYDQLVQQKKQLILEQYMVGEWNNLVRYFFELDLAVHPDVIRWRQAIAALMIAMPVYRLYPATLPLTGAEKELLQETFAIARQWAPDQEAELRHLEFLFFDTPAGSPNALRFLKRLMQFTGPLTAKGVEDTTFYVYNAFIAHNEVGDEAAAPGMTIDHFHEIMQQRQQTIPLSLNATATHDTKRGEDGRMRLLALSELPQQWQEQVQQWYALNQPLHTPVNGAPAPTVNDEYFIYQSIISGFPADLSPSKEWIERLQQYLVKVLRESKVNSNWEDPDTAYEAACMLFIERLFEAGHEFEAVLVPFLKQVLPYASIYSLSQVLLKMTSPGIPDIYQGCELWDLSYVDPDNRRLVDYPKAGTYLQRLKEKEQQGTPALLAYLEQHRAEAMEKLYVTWKTLDFRRRQADLFTQGAYLPLQVTGDDTYAIAYARQKESGWVLTVVPVNLAKHPQPFTEEAIVLPEEAPKEWQNLFTRQTLTIKDNRLLLKDILTSFPVAMLTAGV